MYRLFEYLNSHTDKVIHFLGGYMIASFFTPILGVSIVIIVAAIKEIADKETGKGTPDIFDFLATTAGGALAVVVSIAKGGM